jgi:phosphoribosylglycinamide formyltransferase-1
MDITLVTYDTPHEKTERVFWSLYNKKEHKINLLFVPFFPRKKRESFFRHRPEQLNGAPVRDFFESVGFDCFEYADRDLALKSDYLLVCGANLLEREFAKSGKIINCHAGLIPQSRGLDSFKWAIREKKPIGNTLHIIDSRTDMGQVLHHLKTPMVHSDTLASFARIHYENELWLLSNFDRFLVGGEVLDLPVSEPTMRMPVTDEKKLPDWFDEYKSKFMVR